MLQNHQGGREKNFEHSEAYKDVIKDYMEARGYDLIGDSKDDNTTVDQIFRKTYEYGSTDVWVEAKDTDLSRTDADFLREFALYFIEYQQRPSQEPFQLHLYIRNLKAPTKWGEIFQIAKQDSDRIETFYDRILTNDVLSDDDRETFKQYPDEDFVDFVSNQTTIHQATYNKLRMEVDRLEKSDRYDFDERFTQEHTPINEREELEPNFAEIADLPDHLYIGELDLGVYDARAVKLKLDRVEPFWFESNKVYSLRPPEEFPDVVEQVTQMETVKQHSFDEWATKAENTSATISLLQREICRQCIADHIEDVTAVKYRGDFYLFFEHDNLDVEKQEVENQLVSKAFTEGSSRFVRHRSAQISVFRFNDEYFLSVLVKNLFTKNGRKFTLLRGEQNKALHDIFNQNNYNNSQAFSEYRHWRRILNIHNREKDTTGQSIKFRKITETALNKRTPGGKTEIETRDTDTQQQTFTDFL